MDDIEMSIAVAASRATLPCSRGTVRVVGGSVYAPICLKSLSQVPPAPFSQGRWMMPYSMLSTCTLGTN